LEIADYPRTVRRRCRWIALQTKEYSSSARLFVSTANLDDASALAQGGQFSQQWVQSYAALVSSRELARAVISELDLDMTADELVEQVVASVTTNTVNLTINATDADPHRAQSIAQAYPENLTGLVRQLETAPGETTAPIKATIVDNPSYSDTPCRAQASAEHRARSGRRSPARLRSGVAAADRRHASQLDRGPAGGRRRAGSGRDQSRPGNRHCAAGQRHRPPLAAGQGVPSAADQPAVRPRRQPAEDLRRLLGRSGRRKDIHLDESRHQSRADRHEDAVDRGRPTSPEGTPAPGLDGAVGLTSLLVGKVKLADVLQTHEASGLDFIASESVPPNPAELQQSNATADVLRDLRALYDFVAIDAPPLLPVTDAALIAAKADGALLVVRHGRSTRDQVRHSIERLTPPWRESSSRWFPRRPRDVATDTGTATRPISRMAENGMGCALRALAGFVSGRTEITP
jgi:hypothetical protein